jgi:AraC-like DNA-binding protein
MVHRSEFLHHAHFKRYYQRALPSHALKPFVSEYWKLESYSPLSLGVAEHFMPRVESLLVFPFANRLYYQSPGTITAAIQLPHLVYPQAQALACLHPASKDILGITLTPAGLMALQKKLKHSCIQGVALLPELESLQENLDCVAVFSEQCALFEQNWLNYFQADTVPDFFPKAFTLLAAGSEIGATAAKLGLTSRSLQRHFKQSLGLSPRTCQRVLRLRQTVQELWQNPDYTIWDSGYCDYSHFYKEFKALMGLSPSVYLAQFQPQ